MLYILVPIIAFMYASVGFGGATGYLAAMSLFDLPPALMASTALMLNILVASVSFSAFYRAGHLRPGLLFPFLVTSVPAAFIGGYFKIHDAIYAILLYSVLTFVALRLLFFSTQKDERPIRQSPPHLAALAIGLGVGLLSGMIGIGGGIFLSPVIILARWGTSKQASAVSAAFIVLNSISGLGGRILGGTFMLDSFSLALVPLGLIGALLGSYSGAKRLSNLNLQRTLGLVMLLIIGTYWFRW